MAPRYPEMPRYPEIQITVHSRNPFALIGAVRQALRQAGVERQEIQEFSRQAFDTDEKEEIERLCGRWANLVIAD